MPFSLKAYNTFGIEAFAQNIISIESDTQLIDFLKVNQEPIFILGGGSNILLTQNIEATVLHNQIKGIKLLDIQPDYVLVRVGGGEVWQEFVEWAIMQNLGGIENMSLIPGTVGASPIQNIGAYGTELKDVFHSLEAIDLQYFTKKNFVAEECQFGYRDSYFKREGKGKYFISSVTFCLRRNPTVNTQYGDIQKILAERQIESPTIKDVSEAIITIRQSKLPNPAELGNAGSFFKNPTISQANFEIFITQFPNAPHYKVENNQVKIPAGWLIEQAGWKGFRLGDAGCHAKQALVLVNYGNASGNNILSLSQDIQADILAKFNLMIQAEVNLI
jgi:UDP-N-acetylmuramate dehydrogenase